MIINPMVDQVPAAALERLATAAEDGAVPGVDRTAINEVIDSWCLDLDPETDEVVVSTILALGARAVLADRAARTIQAAA